MTTGARRGELCGLRWSHVDLPLAADVPEGSVERAEEFTLDLGRRYR